MESDVSIEFRDGLIIVRHVNDFAITPTSMSELWTALGAVCRKYNCSRVLVEGRRPRRRMDTIAAFESGIEASEVYPNLAVALYLSEYEPDEMSELFITAARNRGARIKFFADRNAALRWLGVEVSE